MFTSHNPIEIKYLTRLRLGFSYLRFSKFKHDLLDAVDPLCSCSTAIENTVHYFLHCPNFYTAQNTFLNEIAIVDRSIINQDEIKITQTFRKLTNYYYYYYYYYYYCYYYYYYCCCFTILFPYSVFILVICSISFVQTLHIYSFPGNNMYFPGDRNILLISVCDLCYRKKNN